MGQVWFVGAGPGATDLITVRGRRLLERAGAILYAGSLVARAATEVAPPGCEIRDSSDMTLEAMTDWLLAAAARHDTVVRLQTGDPALYGALIELSRPLTAAGVPWAAVPGVSSALAAAAAAGETLTLPEVTQTVILTRVAGRTPMPPGERLEELARHGCTLCLFLSIDLLPEVERSLRAAGWADAAPILVVRKATWPDEELILRGTLADIVGRCAAAGIGSPAMIVASPALGAADWPDLVRSRLYDPVFAHRFRAAARTTDAGAFPAAGLPERCVAPAGSERQPGDRSMEADSPPPSYPRQTPPGSRDDFAGAPELAHDTTLLLIGHGSRNPAGNAEVLRWADLWRARHPDWRIEVCFIELAEILLAEGLDRAAAGARQVLVLPLILNAAGHVKMELPVAVRAARVRHPETRFLLGRHLGLGDEVREILRQRLRLLMLELEMPDPRTTGVILLGRGSSDAGANAELARLARRLFESGDHDLVEIAFTGVAWPRLETVVQRQVRLGMTQIAVLPVYLFTGRLMERIRAQIERLRRQYPQVAFALAGHFGFEPAVLELVDARALALASGDRAPDALLECDGCRYRLAAERAGHGHDHDHHHGGHGHEHGHEARGHEHRHAEYGQGAHEHEHEHCHGGHGHGHEHPCAHRGS